MRAGCGKWVLVGFLGAWTASQAQVSMVRQPSAGRLLVASRGLGDPNFVHTVILLVHYDSEGAMGVVLNRPSDAPLRRMFPRAETLKGRKDPLYEGGPVMPEGAVALVRSTKNLKSATHVRDDVYLVGDARVLEDAVNQGKGPDQLRVFLGYAGWGPGQLDGEILAGAWHVFEADLGTVFDPVPDDLWEKLIAKTEERIAQVRYLDAASAQASALGRSSDFALHVSSAVESFAARARRIAESL